MKEYIDRAVILKISPYSEDDAMVVVFTECFGKITLIVKGVFKPNSKNKPFCRIGSVVGIEFFLASDQAELGKLKKLHYDISFLSEDLLEQSSVSLCCEVMNAFLPVHHAEKQIFYEYITLLEKKNHTPFFAIAYCLKISSFLGMLPNFIDAKKLMPCSYFFWNETKGIVSTSSSESSQISLSLEIIKLLHTITVSPLQNIPPIQFSLSQWNEFWRVWWQFFSWHVSWFPKSKKIIEEII